MGVAMRTEGMQIDPRRHVASTWQPGMVFFLGVASFLFPLVAPIAWYAGVQYSDDCARSGVHPQAVGVIGRRLGGTVTITLLVVLAYLVLLHVFPPTSHVCSICAW